MPSLPSTVLRDEGPRGGYTAHHTPLPPSHPRLLLAFQHISMQQIMTLVSMETPARGPHPRPPPSTHNTVGLARQRWSHVSLLPCPRLRNPLLVSTKALPTHSHGSGRGSPAGSTRWGAGLLLPERRLAPTAPLQTGPSSKTALASSLNSLLCFAHGAFTAFPRRTPLPMLCSSSALQLEAPGDAQGHIPAGAPAEVQSAKRTQNH